MGSTIGDYVHYQARNYLKYGTNHIGQEGSSGSNAKTIFKNQKKIQETLIRNESLAMSPQDRQKLEQRLMNIMRPPLGDEGAVYDELWASFINYFEHQFEEGVGIVRRETANIYAAATIPNLKKITPKKTASEIQISTIMKRVEAIFNAFRAISTKGSAEKNYLENLLNEIDNGFNQITEIGRQNLTSIAELPQSLILNNRRISLNSAKPIIDIINKAVAVASGTANLQKGLLFEEMIAIAPFLGKKKALDNIEQIIKESVVGTSGKSSVTFDSQMFLKGVDMQAILGNRYSQQINSSLWKTTLPSPDKVDVKLEWKENAPKLNISAKNVNLGSHAKGVHLVSNTSLLSVLTSLDNIDMVNHYLNISTSTYRGSINHLGGAIYSDAKKALNLSILENAFKGYKSAEKAEVFIINDNQTGTVKVFNIPTLILKALDSNDFTNGTIQITPDVGSLTFKNYWGTTIKARITNLLASVHSNKVSVTLQPWFFAS